MPLIPTPTEPENAASPENATREASGSEPVESGPQLSPENPNAPLSFVPHAQPGVVKQIAKIRTGRFGELDEHELIRLLDTIEDERARARFRESVYISVFFWMIVVWVLLYGPRYLWHAPKLVDPMSVLKDREQLTRLNAPVLRPRPAPGPKAEPKVDNHTLEKLRAAEPKVTTPAPAPAPAATAPNPAPTPAAPPPPPTVQPSRTPPPVVADAPLPQAPTRPNFSTPGTASDAMRSAIDGAAHDRGGGLPSVGGGSRGGGLGTGVDILSDTQGVNFNPYLQKILREIYEQWVPLLPDETRPPISKTGTTLIRFTIMPDGRVSAMNLDGSTHDDAINKAAWGSINAVGQFPPLPKEFHGPNLELRIDFEVLKPGQSSGR
jgi:TonB family protein